MPDFGRFVKEMRTRKGMSLREFCRLANLDPGNWSKVERGKFPPPKSRKVVSDIASILLIERGSRDWNRLFDLAAVGHIPPGLLAEPSTSERINVFFRLAHGDSEPSFEELNRVLGPFKLRKKEKK